MAAVVTASPSTLVGVSMMLSVYLIVALIMITFADIGRGDVP
ncbi:hypothetical protein [Mycobacterium leprae]|nr:hypothetical protein [Mycobacterium leprae]